MSTSPAQSLAGHNLMTYILSRGAARYQEGMLQPDAVGAIWR